MLKKYYFSFVGQDTFCGLFFPLLQPMVDNDYPLQVQEMITPLISAQRTKRRLGRRRMVAISLSAMRANATRLSEIRNNLNKISMCVDNTNAKIFFK